MKRLLSFVIALALCLPVFTVHGQQQAQQRQLTPDQQQAQQRQLTPDQQHELKTWRELRNAGDPPNFGKRFVKPQAKDIERLVEDSWIVTFAYTVTADNLEKTALSLAKQYGLKVRKDSLMKGEYARMALFVGPEDAAQRMAEDSAVRVVEQDAIPKVRGLIQKPNDQSTAKPHKFNLHLPALVKRQPLTDGWAESIHDAIGAHLRPEYKAEDLIDEHELADYRHGGDATNIKAHNPEQGGQSNAG